MNSLDRLHGFYWVARTGGYARAVRAFPYPITEPGVHQQVRRLEAELGLRLFRRAAKDRMVLTPHGRALYEVVGPFLESLRVTVDALRTGSFGGVLRIGAAALLVQELLPGWLRALHRRHPAVDVTLTELRAPEVALLRSGELDLLVDHLPEVPADVEVREVGRLWGFLVLPASHPAARLPRVDPRRLTELPFLTFAADPASRALQRRAVEALAGSARERFAADSTASLLGFVAAGLGFSVVPALHPDGPRRAGVRAVRLRLPGSELPVHAAWLRGVPNPMLTRAIDVAPAAPGRR
ncbi:MAG TPA: LysR substrate-binding domain-containing protein [Myxococcaceae bacterium]|nr:LysR substrate-binding domain-containing protein [Myxococcaceae bacterium]